MKLPINKKLIFDNAVLSNFARINKLELLFYLSKNLITTNEVVEEITKGIPRKPELSIIIDLINSDKISVGIVSEVNNILLMNNLIKEGILGMGEISSIVLAGELEGIFITDDEHASKRAAKLNVKILDNNEYRDTLVILDLLLENSHITKSDKVVIMGLLAKQSFAI